MAREEALGQLQRERAALEETRATLQKQEEKVSRLNGELVQISISHEDQRQALEEQEASFLKLRGEAEETRQSLEVEKKQVEGDFVSVRLSLIDSFFWGPLPTSSLSCSWLPGLQTALGHATTRAETLQVAYNSSQQELEELRATVRQLRKARRKLGARWQAACALFAGTSRGGCTAPSTWASRRPSAW
jgi:chromosome segregation ATPase